MIIALSINKIINIKPQGRVSDPPLQIAQLAKSLAYTGEEYTHMNKLSGHVIKSYTVLDEIAVGGFGAVYRAYQPIIEREVALKVILPRFANEPDFIRRFEVEAQTIARLEHPYIVPLYDFWRDPNGAYLIMRLMRGGNLRDMIRREMLSPEQVLAYLEEIASALGM